MSTIEQKIVIDLDALEKYAKDVIEDQPIFCDTGLNGHILLELIQRLRTAEAKLSINVDGMVDAFLGWKLPSDFSPDCGISFRSESEFEHPKYGRHKYEPIGTNLFDADQAKAMFEQILAKAAQRRAETGSSK